MTQNSKTGAAFIAGGTITGVSVSATVGGMGLAGGFGAVGIGCNSCSRCWRCSWCCYLWWF
ncbi:hypothetical protein [Nostoc sp.]|uniref:hypothetical protein n=1 Tax=Nostoc sp. TaxID=1180 RepID=UPI002FF7B590